MAAFAQEAAAETAAKAGSIIDLNGLAAALASIGAAFGISRIGASAVESMARQPEASGSINSAMIVSAALIEGATFFALIICLLGILG
ncbi:MAG: ATP synthase F0 subunit C [Thermoguttaceae bacterium]|nr:ATP synthase F0 subunit C [Thermoguttaceae bacterium]